MKIIPPLMLSGREVLPLIEGGKGISVTNGESSGAWAGAGGVGTFSGVNADSRDGEGRLVRQVYHGRTRRQRHKELLDYAVDGALYQARIAHETASGQGRLHMNILWEMAGAEHILKKVLSRAKGIINGVTCGAGMPYRLAEICSSFGVYYYPIISSARAFNALWRRAYHKFCKTLGAVVYEDPWLAGGHNGLSNKENPEKPEPPRARIVSLRRLMNSYGLHTTPIIMAGGVWYLREWDDWIDDPDIAPIAFQFGTRPLLTKESPISDAWKRRLVDLKEGDILLHRHSPTGFYSSAVQNRFLCELEERGARQISYRRGADDGHTVALSMGRSVVHVTPDGAKKAEEWKTQGYLQPMRTPDQTLIFTTHDKALAIRKDQADCMGCLSACLFSNWAENEQGTTGRKSDPRSFCIQKTLQDVSHNHGDIEDELMFSGHNAYHFGRDPFYKNGFIPTVKQLIDRILTGN